MASEPLKHVLRLIGWGVIPNRLTTFLLPYYFQFFSGQSPAPGSPEAKTAYRRVYGFVIGAYLSYNLYQAAFNQPPNLYQLLKVGIDADDGRLKAAFRSFARKNHPDKVGASGEALFMTIRDAYESLRHPVKRFAYDRFGPDALSWERVASYKEYLEMGLWQSSGFYIGIGFMMGVYAFLGETDSGTVWRLIFFIYAAFAELMLCVQPPPLPYEGTTSSIPIPEARSPLTFPLALIRMIFPHWVPYQHVAFLHEIFITVSLAITRIVPVVFPDEGRMGNGMTAADEQLWANILGRIARSTQNAEVEVDGLIRRELTAMRGPTQYDADGQPITRAEGGNDPSMQTLSVEMEQVLVDTHIRSHPMLRSLWDEVVKRSRQAVGLEPSATVVEVTDDAEVLPEQEDERDSSTRAGSTSRASSPVATTFEVNVKSEDDGLPSPPLFTPTIGQYIIVGSDDGSPSPAPHLFDRPGLRTRRQSSHRNIDATGSPVPSRGTKVLDPFGSPVPIMRFAGAPSPAWIKEEVASPLGGDS